jgi:hypothetical protein
VIVEQRPVETRVSPGAALTLVSVILGIVLGVGGIVGIIGRAFYVERSEYNVGVVSTAEDRTKVAESLKQQAATMVRLEAAIDRLCEDVSRIKQDVASMRGRGR